MTLFVCFFNLIKIGKRKMKNKIFLSSMLIMSVAPAMAENFPSNGLMQENKTYDNAATSTNMDGVYSGTVNATAEYENILYNIVAGNYLPGGSEETNGSQCTPGNFCTGLTNATYSESDQGLTSCSTLGDGSYTLSPAGATNGNMCYKTCSASCTNPTAPAHSTNVTYGHETSTGTWNYGASCNAVAPTCSINFDCVNGYHKRPDLTVAQGVALMKQMAQMQGQDITNVPDSYFESQVIDGYANWGAFWSSLSAAEQGMVTQAIDTVQGHQHNEQFDWQPYQEYNEINNSVACTGFEYVKTIDGNEVCKTLNSCDSASISGTQINCDVVAQQNSDVARFRQSAQNGDWFVTITDKNIYYSGRSRCDTSRQDWQGIFEITSINGYDVTTIWIDGFLDLNGAECRNNTEFDAAEGAVGLLRAASISDDIKSYISFNYYYIDYMCDANTITINWNDVDPEYAGQNGEDTAKYDGDIKTPFKAATKKGQRFKGWRFVDPTKVSLSE